MVIVILVFKLLSIIKIFVHLNFIILTEYTQFNCYHVSNIEQLLHGLLNHCVECFPTTSEGCRTVHSE